MFLNQSSKLFVLHMIMLEEKVKKGQSIYYIDRNKLIEQNCEDFGISLHTNGTIKLSNQKEMMVQAYIFVCE